MTTCEHKTIREDNCIIHVCAECGDTMVDMLRDKVKRLEEEIVRFKHHYDMVGDLLEPIREKRSTGEPARGDRKEIITLIGKSRRYDELMKEEA